MAKNKKQTSKSIASLAAKTLTDDNSSQIAKKLADSALSQKSSTSKLEVQSKILHQRFLRALNIVMTLKPWQHRFFLNQIKRDRINHYA